ncbi:hypothetical protein BC939DRAFT_198023 [Gamsiella multidivaricata]|uniref:uncharacterized protein n=1 Tax=Gamsiella multidivaricata TaxID=101098 RepID=UPI00221E7904|nr:uncharacterized protein BC939DRAFT_198023 [Gamsiella multidivaricata]KAI7821861.1 hypothetical protein BC939DRAFT_198023 [Gamsiella multidivaricata]
MEVNKDEALRCLEIARRHLSSGNYAAARKFGLKSTTLFPTPEAEAFVSRVVSEESTAVPASGASSASEEPTPHRTKSSSTAGGGGPSAKGTSSARSNTTPLRSRSTPVDHKPVERDYTPEQAAAVKAVRSCGGDFYKILGVNKNATDAEIKKAYRKVALQMHPDKNGAPGADEAFKIVSKAFTVLSDPQKRAIFDQHGPEDGRDSSVNYDRATPTAQHFSYSRRGEEISPEELFNMFFGGGSFGGSFHSTSFGGPGHGGRSRAQQTHHHQQRQQHYRQQHQQQRQQRANATANAGLGSSFGSVIQLLPLIILILVTMSSGFFSSDSSSSSSQSSSILNDFSLRPRDTYTTARHTGFRNVPYFVNEVRFMNTYFPGQQFEFKSSGARQINVKADHVTLQGRRVGPLFKRMEDNVEVAYLREMQNRCKEEKRRKDTALNKAMGFWGPDRKLWKEAQRMTTPSCDVVKEKYGKQYVR